VLGDAEHNAGHTARVAKTYCRICEAACGLEVESDDRSLSIRPDRAHPVSHGFVCAKGTRFAEVAFHPARLKAPCVRDARGILQEVSWREALDEAGRRVRPILERYGPNAVGVYVGNPLAFHALGQFGALFFGKALGTRNVFTAGTQDCNNKFAAAGILHGSPAIHPIPDFERAELAVLLGTNPAVSQSSFVHLEGGASIFDRMEERGARIVWVDVRKTESAKRWGELVRIKPGTDVWLLLAMLALLADRAKDDPRVEGLDRLLELAREVTPERAEKITGIDAAAIRALASSIGSKRTALHMSVGVNQGPFGTLSYVVLQAIAYVSGNYDRAGGSLFSPLGVGAGKVMRRLGFFHSDETSRIGGFPTVFDSLPGGVLADEITTEGDERIRAMIVIAGDPVRSIPGARSLGDAMKKLDALVCVDMFESLTARSAHVLLPVRSWLERADFALPGLPLQTVDLLQTSARTIEPVGDTRTDHAALAELSVAIGRPMFGSAALAHLLARADTDRAIELATELAWRIFDRRPETRGYGIRVPAPRPDSYLGSGPLTPEHRVRFWDERLAPERDRLLEHERSLASSGGFVLLGRRRRIGHNSWLHGGTREGKLEGEAWLAKSDMLALGLADGAPVELRTSAAALELPAYGDDGVAPGTVVVPHGELEVNVNELIPSGPSTIERLSGMCLMTGIPVEVRPR
jgi:anaerobic selenocysteine-containing dehydrogenase